MCVFLCGIRATSSWKIVQNVSKIIGAWTWWASPHINSSHDTKLYNIHLLDDSACRLTGRTFGLRFDPMEYYNFNCIDLSVTFTELRLQSSHLLLKSHKEVCKSVCLSVSTLQSSTSAHKSKFTSMLTLIFLFMFVESQCGLIYRYTFDM